MTDERKKLITIPSATTVAEVEAMPDEVFVKIHTGEGFITPEQARELAALLIAAADEAPHLDWDDDADNPGVIDTRETPVTA